MRVDSNITAIITGGASGLGEATAATCWPKKRKRLARFDLNEKEAKRWPPELWRLFCQS